MDELIDLFVPGAAEFFIGTKPAAKNTNKYNFLHEYKFGKQH